MSSTEVVLNSCMQLSYQDGLQVTEGRSHWEEALAGQRNVVKSSGPHTPGACRTGTQEWTIGWWGDRESGQDKRWKWLSPGMQGWIMHRGGPASAFPFAWAPSPPLTLRQRLGSRQSQQAHLTAQPAQQNRDDKGGLMWQLCKAAPVAWPVWPASQSWNGGCGKE